MTVEERVKQLLSESMTEDKASDTLELFKESEHGKLMEVHWSDAAKDYSLPILVGLVAYIKSTMQCTVKGK